MSANRYHAAMSEQVQSIVRGQAIWMIVAAALFGYFGFGSSWPHRFTAATPPQPVIMVFVLMWSLRVGAIAFAISAVLSMLGSIAGLWLYAVVGIITAVAFVAVAVWDMRTPTLFAGISPVLLLIFAAWNGYSSVLQLRELAQIRQAAQSY